MKPHLGAILFQYPVTVEPYKPAKAGESRTNLEALASLSQVGFWPAAADKDKHACPSGNFLWVQRVGLVLCLILSCCDLPLFPAACTGSDCVKESPWVLVLVWSRIVQCSVRRQCAPYGEHVQEDTGSNPDDGSAAARLDVFL
jgi:hypothetical protein